MATLEKIRSKSVLLVVIIAVALLAFILGDAITNGRNLFGNNTTVAKIGDKKIDIQDYQRKQQELSQREEELRKNNPQAASDPQTLSQRALDELIQEQLVSEAVTNLGIQASPEMLRFFMIENPQTVLPEMQQLIAALQQSGISVTSPAEAYDVIFQPQKHGLSARQMAPFQQNWVILEKKYNDQITYMIYNMLSANSVKANKLDIAAMKRDYVTAANVKVAKKPYGNLSAKDYPVSDAEIQKLYNEQKERYALDETTKRISFIAVNVPPSNKDVETSSLLAATVVKELRGNGQVSKETRKNGLDIQRHDMRLSDVKNQQLKAFLQSAPLGRDSIISQNQTGFLIAKVNNRTTQVDSIEVSTISVQGGKDLVEKVLAYTRSDFPIDSINNRFSKDSVAYQAPQWMPLYTAAGSMKNNLGIQTSTLDSLTNSNGSYMVILEQDGIAVLGAVKNKKAPKEIVEYETYEYELHPSETTLADARQKLQKFISQNNTAAKFVKNAKAAGYNPEDLEITPSTPAISKGFNQYYADSRALVRWVVMDGKDGEVSKIYQSKDPAHPALYVAAVVNTYEEYLPWNDKRVKEELTAQIRRDKAGDKMVKQYSKATLEEAAQAMQVEPVTVEKLQLAKQDMTVTDQKVKGRIMGSKASNKLQVVKGDDGVYAYIIEEVVQEPVQMTDENFAQMAQQLYQINPAAALRGKKKIENNVYKFEMGE